MYDCYGDHIEGEGHELWPGMLPHEELQRRKAVMGSLAFQSEYRNNPVSDETAAIKEGQIRYWTIFPVQYSSVITVDPAYSDDEKADYKVATHVCIDLSGNRYLGSYIRTHMPIGEFQDAIINLWLQNRGTVTAIGIRTGGTEKAFLDSILKKCDERKVYPPIAELKNTYTNAMTEVS